MKKLLKSKKFLLSKFKGVNDRGKVYSKKTLAFIQRKPFTSFFVVLGILLVLMIVGNLLFSPKPEAVKTQNASKKVQIYKIGSAPLVTYQGKVEKSGVTKIVAQMPGVVSYINVYEGQQVGVGANILGLSTNYSGGNALSIARQIAGNQYQSAKDNYPTQKELIGKQRELANKSDESADKLREIARGANDQTQGLIDLNTSILDTLAANQSALEALPQSADNDAKILQIRSTRAQLIAGNNQLQAGLNNSKYANSEDNAPAAIGNISKDVALRQLDLQEKALDLSLELSRLSFNMAQINEASMYPSSPFAGIIERIFVHPGDTVNPGTVLANLSGNTQHSEIVVLVSEGVAKNISSFEPSILIINGKEISLMPSYVSRDATNGNLYSVIYQLDDSFSRNLTNGGYVDVRIPVGVADASNIDPFIPLDSVIQTQDEAFVYVVNGGKAEVKKITLGQIQGRFVEALTGLPKDAEIILDRNVIEGDKVLVVR